MQIMTPPESSPQSGVICRGGFLAQAVLAVAHQQLLDHGFTREQASDGIIQTLAFCIASLIKSNCPGERVAFADRLSVSLSGMLEIMDAVDTLPEDDAIQLIRGMMQQ
jgi:hypothetical protein